MIFIYVMEEKNSKYYYKKYDEIYGLIYTAKSLIEINRKQKPEITMSDIEYIKNFLISGIDDILKEEEVDS